ncbi:sugar porter family MFS transporter [Paeniglutamicibacter gangotriensis]|uniref:D-xylose transporter XylE n=1 Tax=Paeniglutamicibacter gangotriensis Lz1y TaxID=1276920 RepID=M7N012_9MICC|nr:sugar porter family MFS transporter [Paeniglutamicibacter gangotriensis]EMR00551.1 D-xylose transporter XylE [Paeniglutamicibacter gangotriensis Lz1y]
MPKDREVAAPIESDGRVTPRLVAMASTAALGGFLFGFDSAIINGTVDAVREQFSLGSGLLGFTVSCALLGAALGAWFAGVCSQRFGRVRTMLIASVLLTISALGCGLAFGVWDLILWRFIGGIGVGFASVIAPAYIAEIAPAKQRGRLGTLQQLALVSGIFLAFLLSAMIAWLAGGASEITWFGLEAWRWMFLTGIVPSLVYGILASRLPESPRYLVEKNDDEGARKVLIDVVGMSAGEATDQKIAEIKSTVNLERRQRFADLFGGKFGFKTLIWVGILLSIFQQLVGINVIFYYSTTMWKSVGFQESDSFMISVITSVTNIVATIVAISLVDKVGRKLLLLVGSGMMTLSLGTMAVAFAQAVTVNGELSLPGHWGIVALVAANLFVVGFGASWGPVVWVLLGEMFPNNIRALALGLGAAAQWIANFVVSTTFPALADLGLQVAYGLYAGFALLSFLFVWRMVRETNGRQLEDMTL